MYIAGDGRAPGRPYRDAYLPHRAHAHSQIKRSICHVHVMRHVRPARSTGRTSYDRSYDYMSRHDVSSRDGCNKR